MNRNVQLINNLSKSRNAENTRFISASKYLEYSIICFYSWFYILDDTEMQTVAQVKAVITEIREYAFFLCAIMDYSYELYVLVWPA